MFGFSGFVGVVGWRLVAGTDVVDSFSNRLREVGILQAIARLIRGNWYDLVFNLDDNIGRALSYLARNRDVKVSNLVAGVLKLLDGAWLIKVNLGDSLLSTARPTVVSQVLTSGGVGNDDVDNPFVLGWNIVGNFSVLARVL